MTKISLYFEMEKYLDHTNKKGADWHPFIIYPNTPLPMHQTMVQRQMDGI